MPVKIKVTKEEALDYHEFPRPGKIEYRSFKPVQTRKDLSLTYTPGVAYPCLEIADDPENAYRYTGKGNTVAIISNGTAVLGLGDIGATASKPVMEGKAVLFRKYAGINAIDLEIDEKDPKKLAKIIKSLEPGLGGINVEDVKAPECFELMKILEKELNIPVFHDDQYGTAVVIIGALINALILKDKKLKKQKVVMNGAGSAAIATADLLIKYGLPKKNLFLCDSKGLVSKDREDLNKYKKRYAQAGPTCSLEEVLKDSDIFIGLSIGNLMTPEMLKSMSPNPIVFALANPTPEIDYHLAKETRNDVLLATGRSDFPNQINNALGFPYLFRAALDTRVKQFTYDMLFAAAEALSDLARTDKYNEHRFGVHYILPSVMDKRILEIVTPKIAEAALKNKLH